MATNPKRAGKFKLKEDGVWFIDSSQTPAYVSPYILKKADLVSRRGWQTIFEFTDGEGIRQTVTSPRSAIKKIGALRDLLLDNGFDWPDVKSDEEHWLWEYLRRKPSQRITVVEKTGWFQRHTFVFQTTAIGPHAASVRYRSFGDEKPDDGVRGNLDVWRTTINRIAPYSSSAMLALGTAFGAPFHEPLRIESGGFNLFGPKGKGKTSAAVAAESVFMKSGRDAVLTWDITESALDELRCERSDMLVYLDDMGRSGSNDPRKIEKISDAVFRLTTGAARKRSKAFKVDPGLPAAWIAVLSTSVRSMLDISLAAGSHVFGGEEVRLIDVPAVVSEKLGVFEECPSDFRNTRDAIFELESVCAAHYGIAGRAYIKQIVAEKGDATVFVRRKVDAFVQNAGATGTSETRYVQRFGLAYAGLKLASKYGIIDLPKGAAWKAIRACYLRARETAPTFPQTMANALSAFRDTLLELNNILDLSISDAKTTKDEFEQCSGVLLRHADHGAVFAVKYDQLGALSSPTLTPRHVVDALKERGLLLRVKGGKSTIPVTIPGLGKKHRQRLICVKRRDLRNFSGRS